LTQVWNDTTLPWQTWDGVNHPWKNTGISWNDPSLPWKQDGGARITLSSLTLLEGSAADTLIGALSTSGTTGTPSFTLTNTAGNKAKITGSNLLAGATATDYETATTFTVTVSVSGVTPTITDTQFTIFVLNVVEDTTPAAFSFTDVTNASLSTVYTSNAITVSGVDGASTVTVTGGTYSINGGAYTSSAGSAVSGDTITVRGTSSGSYSTAVNVVLSVGGNVTAATTDTYTITTMADPGGGGSSVDDDYAAWMAAA
jgi:hypothetical protein